jgi:hypothetical protein
VETDNVDGFIISVVVLTTLLVDAIFGAEPDIVAVFRILVEVVTTLLVEKIF